MKLSIVDLLARYVFVLLLTLKAWIPAIATALLLSLPISRRQISRLPEVLLRYLPIVFAVGGVLWAWSLSWVSDDVFIAFRYAENLVQGNGLVFNVGERVEGYTDFLWVLLSAVAIGIGADPAQSAVLINLASFAVIILLVAHLSRKVIPNRDVVPIGFAAILTAAHYTMASFGTAGIETMFAAMLTIVALERMTKDHFFLAGLAGTAATMTHPDHIILYASLAVASWLCRKRFRELLRYFIPFVLAFVPYFIWRWSYYGDIMPNTYYAKSADQVYINQGLMYFLVTLVGNGLWAVVPLAVWGAFQKRRTLIVRYTLIAFPVYLFYVIKIGGDFMMGRLFLPVIPLIFILAEIGFRSLVGSGRSKIAILAVLMAFIAVLPTSVIGPGDVYHGIADERTFSKVARFSPMTVDAKGYVFGRLLHRIFTSKGFYPKLGFGYIGMISYYSKLPLFDLGGLTSRNVAHLPIATRGRPGHEKKASPSQLLEADVELSEMPVFSDPYNALSHLNIGGNSLYLVRYKPEALEMLPGDVEYINFGKHLDKSLKKIRRKTPARIACDLWHMKTYYFTLNKDERRKNKISKKIAKADKSLAGVRSLLLETQDLSKLGWKKLHTFSFASNKRSWTSDGSAAEWFTDSLIPGQSLPFGQVGAFINSFSQKQQDGSRGLLTSRPFTIRGDVLTFMLGGGFDSELLRTDLIVNGQTVRTATGCQSEIMDRRIWDIRPFKSKIAQIVIKDQAVSSWGHITVDEISEWRSPK